MDHLDVLVPWTAINLVDYYLLRHAHYDVDSFFRFATPVDSPVAAADVIGCYVLGIFVQLPFIDTPLYRGFIARAMGGDPWRPGAHRQPSVIADGVHLPMIGRFAEIIDGGDVQRLLIRAEGEIRHSG